MALFLASFPDGAQRKVDRTLAGTQYLQLPTASWLRDSLVEQFGDGADVDMLSRLNSHDLVAQARAAHLAVNVSSVLKITQAGCTSTDEIQAPYHRETELLRQYYCISPCDSYDIFVEDVHMLKNAEPLIGKQKRIERNNGSTFQPISLQVSL